MENTLCEISWVPLLLSATLWFLSACSGGALRQADATVF